MNTAQLIEQLIAAATEKGILYALDAPLDEMKIVQKKIDQLQEELFRRTAW